MENHGKRDRIPTRTGKMKIQWTKAIDKRYKHKRIRASNETWVMEADTIDLTKETLGGRKTFTSCYFYNWWGEGKDVT